jgi:hypothetical protein
MSLAVAAVCFEVRQQQTFQLQLHLFAQLFAEQPVQQQQHVVEPAGIQK